MWDSLFIPGGGEVGAFVVDIYLLTRYRNVSNMTQDDDQWIERYELIAKDPYSWLHTASSLIYAATKALIKETEGPLKGLYQHIPVYMMLSSFAIENIIKCIIIQKKPTVVDNGKLHESIFKHDLLELFQDADINCTPSEKDLLNRLSHFAVQAGRYPVPKSWQIYKDSLSGKGTGKHRSIFLSQDLNTIIGIITKLQNELKRIGIDHDIYDMSYSYTKDGKTVFVERRIYPHQFP